MDLIKTRNKQKMQIILCSLTTTDILHRHPTPTYYYRHTTIDILLPTYYYRHTTADILLHDILLPTYY